MANIVQPTDWFLVQRGLTSKRCSGKDLADSINGGLTLRIEALEAATTNLEAQVAALETEINGGTY